MKKVSGAFMNNLRYVCLIFVVTFGLITIIGSGGGGGGGGGSSSDSTGDTSNGQITITFPTSESSYTEYCNSVDLSGEAFISPTWSRCCTGSAEDTGVTVTWENRTTGESGNASQRVDICYLLFSPYLCDHTWSVSVPLILGDNFIVVTASDPAGETGKDSITVVKPEYTYCISGKVVNMNGRPLGTSVSDIDLHLSGENIDEDAIVYANGSYEIGCIPNGSYTLTPTSPMDYTFEPEYHTIVINGSDVSEINFVGDGYFISGRVKDENDIGMSSVMIDLSSNGSKIFHVYTHNTDKGYYEVAVPNGTYTLTPLYIDFYPHYIFTPKNATVTVNDEDVINVNFLAKLN